MEPTYFPLSLSQKNILHLEELYPHTPINNICTSLYIQGQLDYPLLELILNQLLANDTSLCTRFVQQNKETKQYIMPYCPRSFAVYNFTQTAEKEAEHWADAISKESMPLYHSDMFAFYLFQTAENAGGIILKTHHLISDGFSQVALCNRIAKQYLQRLKNDNPELTPCFSYQSHIEKETAYFASSAYLRDEAYWQAQIPSLADAGMIKEHKGALLTMHGKRASYPLSDHQNHLLSRYCASKRISPFAVYCFLLAVYMRRIKQEDCFTIGVPIVNRIDNEEKNTTGMFVSTLPFCIHIDAEESATSFFEHFQTEWLELLRHQRYPYDKIAHARHAYTHDNKALFAIALSFQNSIAFQSDSALVYFDGRWNYSGIQAEQLCIHLSNRTDQERFTIDYDYQIQLFSDQEIDALHTTLITILLDSLCNPEKPVHALRLLPMAEEERILYQLSNRNQPKIRLPRMKELLLLHGNNHPTRVALIQKEQRTTYAQLMEEAQQLANQIRATNAKTNTVAILMPRTKELLTALLAVILVEKTWLLIDPSLPEKRIQEMLDDAQAELILLSPDASASHSYKQTVVSWTQASSIPQETPHPQGAQRIAYLIYTSGSTGKPKGVRIKEESLVNFAQGILPLYGHGAVLSLCNVSFDAFLLETVVSLLNGQTIVLAEESACNHPQRLASLIRQYAVSMIALTPSRLSSYLKEPSFLQAIARLETIICGGEAFGSDLLQKLRCSTNASIINQYGPSEATIGVSYQQLNNSAMITVGTAMPGAELYILDEFKHCLPINADGEICLGGIALADGYQNNEELTAHAFIPHPYFPQETVYCTGDIGHFNANNELVITGRKDQQIKLHGYRIELEEIAMRLYGHPAITQAVCLLEKQEHASRIIAYYVSEAKLPKETLRNWLLEYLPYYMIPTGYVWMKEFPLTNNGKLDKSRLPSYQKEETTQEDATGCDERLLTLMRQNLENEQFSLHDDYFEHGGDSLKAISLLAEIAETLNIELTMREFYALRTPLAISQRLNLPVTPIDSAPIIPVAIDLRYPLTKAQSAVFVAHSHNQDTSYNMPGMLVFSHTIDLARLQQAFQLVYQQEESFRTRYFFEDGVAYAEVMPATSLVIETLPANTLIEAKKLFVRPFDLQSGKLLRVAIYHTETTDTLFLDMHHIAADGLSTPLFMNRLLDAYHNHPLSSFRYRYRDYALYEKTHSEYTNQLAYWQTQLDGYEGELVIGHPQQEDTGYITVQQSLSQEVSMRIRAFCTQQKLTVSAFFFALYALLLYRLSNQKDIVVGMVVSGRKEQFVMDMIGVFIHTLPVRCDFSTDPEVLQWFQQVQKRSNELLDHQQVTLEEIARAIHRPNDKPLYEALFSMRPPVKTTLLLEEEEVTLLPLDTHTGKVPLSFELYEENDSYSYALTYHSTLGSEAFFSYFLRCYETMAGAALEDTTQPVSQLPLLSEADYRKYYLLPEYSYTPYPRQFLDQYVREQAKIAPAAVAVYYNKTAISRQAFEAMVNRISALLQEAGIKHHDRVAVLLPRSPKLLAALLAINKVGATYVPLDISLPVMRIDHLLRDAECALILVTEENNTSYACSSLVIDKETTYQFHTVTRDSSDAMYLLYTSGSTGNPKGVVIPHNAIMNLLHAMRFVLDDSTDPVLCATNCVFDIFITESLLALAVGRAVVLANEEEMLLPHALAALIQQYHIDLVQFTPSRAALCLGDATFCEALKQVRSMILVGEALSEALLCALQATGPINIYNCYGPTEAAVYVTQINLKEKNKVTIGTTLANCKLYVMDEKNNVLPPEVTGELVIAGECLAIGYYKQPELTNQAFFYDSENPLKRYYRTGDLGYLTLHQEYICLGRKDSQIKFDGHRIELEEINEQIKAIPGVTSAIVLAEKKEDTVTGLVAYVCGTASKEQIVASLKQSLPAYMIPYQFIPVEQFPLNANGKIDTKQLQKQYKQNEPAILCKSTSSKNQQKLTAIWEKALNHPVNPTQSFFVQGGSSLVALGILSEYYQNGYQMSVQQFYDFPTIQEQEKLLFTATSATTNNTICYRQTVPLSPTGDSCLKPILLTGASGYLGAYLLYWLLLRTTVPVYCLVRNKQRFYERLRWYFGDNWLLRNTTRILPIQGDITQVRLGLHPTMYHTLSTTLATIVHSAADVRHYGNEEIRHSNEYGTKQVIQLAIDAHSYLHHISTISVAGSPPENRRLPIYNETMFDIGQNTTENPYIQSKFLAEEAVYAAMDAGLSAHVYRVGHLVGRSSDLRFQYDPTSNQLWRLYQGLSEIGALPQSLLETPLELTPVDEAAQAIVSLMCDKETVSHIYAPHMYQIGDFLALPVIPDETFYRLLLQKEGKYLADVITQLSPAQRIIHTTTDNSNTTARLQAYGFSWTPLPHGKLFQTKEDVQ